MDEKILFAGSGHGGICAIISLQKKFSSIDVLSEDEEILGILRPEDKKINDFMESSAKIGVCAGYLKLIDKEILDNKIIINTHPSILPKYRGRHSLVWAMLNFEEYLGFSIHLMNEKMDDGDLLAQFKLKYDGESSKQIMDMFDDYVLNNLGAIVKKYIDGKIKPTRQDRSQATWFCKRNINDCVIDFEKNKRYIEALFKALVDPYPLPMVRVKNFLYEVLDFEILNINYSTHIGQVVNLDEAGVYIKTIDAILLIKKIRYFDNKNNISISDVFRIGQRL